MIMNSDKGGDVIPNRKRERKYRVKNMEKDNNNHKENYYNLLS